MARAKLFRTRVASRILALFFVGAIVPVVVLEVLSFRAVSDLLEEQSEDRLVQLADATVQIVLERMSSTTSWVQSAGSLALLAAPRGPDTEVLARVDGLAPSVAGIAITDQEGRLTASLSTIDAPPALSAEDYRRLDAGQNVLKRVADPLGEGMYLALPVAGRPGDILWAELEADSIWASAMVLGAGPQVADMCILDADLQPFACKRGDASALPGHLAAAALPGLDGLLRFEMDGEEQVAAWKRVYLRAAYGVPEWIVVVAEDESTVHAPVATFVYNLPLALAVGMGLVLLLTNFLVARTMVPLERLTEGTQRIAGHDLDARVEVDTEDEFGMLARSFNTMAERLDLQFAQLEAAQAIDRAVMEDNNATVAIGALMNGLERLALTTRCAVVFEEASVDSSAGLYRKGGGEKLIRSELAPEQLAEFLRLTTDGHAIVPSDALPLPLLEAGMASGGEDVLLLPMSVQSTGVGYVALQLDDRGSPSPEEIGRARRLVNQAGVALNENRMRRELVEFSGETLRALANAIDAKSRWTTGHSERVTDLAWAVGKRLGLGPKELDLLHRGGLLHDIGKIGVSTAILDHPGKLDEEQRKAVEAHTVIGDRILEPIRVFRPLRPIVLHHHERWDGDGYPNGLSGEEIPFLARVMAVADVFDALASPRPYRDALPMDVVLDHMRSETGRSFDPRVMEAFDAVIADGWVHEVKEGGLLARKA